MKLLPPVLVGIFVIAMCLLRIVLPGPVIVPQPYNLLGLVLIFVGFAVAFSGARQFNRAGTNIKTFDDPTLLVTDGLFGWSRNPMYLGLTVFLIGLAIMLETLLPFSGAVAFAVITDRWYIKFEEQALRRKFGESYETYARRTRRWF